MPPGLKPVYRGWVNMPEWWVNIKRNGGSTWSGNYISIRNMLQCHAPQPLKKWLKSYEVKKILNISTGTLQNLRSNGTLPHTKIGGLIYYDAELINKVLAGQGGETNQSGRPILKRRRNL